MLAGGDRATLVFRIKLVDVDLAAPDWAPLAVCHTPYCLLASAQ
jgi:hypothetical protein